MSPEATASAATLARVLAEIDADRGALAKRIEDAREAERRLAKTPTDPGALALAGVALHAWYTGLETIFERVAREVDGTVPTGDRWHRALLSQMTAEVPGTRPRVIDPALGVELAALLAFRHFFRHAYAVSFDAARLSTELTRLLAVSSPTDAALDAFASFVRAAMTTLTATT
jgi:hypothetical protein